MEMVSASGCIYFQSFCMIRLFKNFPFKNSNCTQWKIQTGLGAPTYMYWQWSHEKHCNIQSQTGLALFILKFEAWCIFLPLIKTLCQPQCNAADIQCTLNFVWYEIWNLVNWFPNEIVILVNLCKTIFFSGFVLTFITDQVNC